VSRGTGCLTVSEVRARSNARTRPTKRLGGRPFLLPHAQGDVGASIRVRLIDQPGHNPNLDFTLADATDVLAELRTEGKEVFVHCAEARSRTAAVGALYAVWHRGVPAGQAWAR
jgi:hypothetical protein